MQMYSKSVCYAPIVWPHIKYESIATFIYLYIYRLDLIAGWLEFIGRRSGCVLSLPAFAKLIAGGIINAHRRDI